MDHEESKSIEDGIGTGKRGSRRHMLAIVPYALINGRIACVNQHRAIFRRGDQYCGLRSRWDGHYHNTSMLAIGVAGTASGTDTSESVAS